MGAPARSLAPKDDAIPVPIERHRPPAPPAANPEALRSAARTLMQAERPVVITSRVGQRPEAVAQLVNVVEQIGAVVVDYRERVNFPSSHPAYVQPTAAARAAIGDADALLVVDCAVPWIPEQVSPQPSATVISMGIDPVQTSMPGWTLPTDLALQCDPLQGLIGLSQALRELGATVGPPAQPPSQAVGAGETSGGSDGPMTAIDVADVLNELLADDVVFVDEAVTNVEPLRTRLRRDQPGTYYRSGGAGLGWGLGAALGVKAAQPDRVVVSIVGDGSFMFGVPTAALWAMKESRTPALIVVLRNGGYAASRRPVLELFAEGASARRGEVIGTIFDDSPDFALLAQACGSNGEHVSTKADFRAAVSRALDVISDKTSVVVVDISSPWIGSSRVVS